MKILKFFKKKNKTSTEDKYILEKLRTEFSFLDKLLQEKNEHLEDLKTANQALLEQELSTCEIMLIHLIFSIVSSPYYPIDDSNKMYVKMLYEYGETCLYQPYLEILSTHGMTGETEIHEYFTTFRNTFA